MSSAVADWKAETRGHGPAQLSQASRQRVFREVARLRGEYEAKQECRLFIPARTLLAAGAAPALLLAAVIGVCLQSGLRSNPTPEIARLAVTKADGEVVFEIQNGDRPHRVYRMEPQGETATWRLVETARGTFRDRLSEDRDLVVYRIE